MANEVSQILSFLEDGNVIGKIIFVRKKKKIKEPSDGEKKKAKKSEEKDQPRISYADVHPRTTLYFKAGYSRFLGRRKDAKIESDLLSDADSGSIRKMDLTEIPDGEVVLGDPDEKDTVNSIDPNFARGLLFMEYKFENSNGEILRVFTHYSSGMFLQSQRRNKVAVIFAGSVLAPVDKDLLLPSTSIDALVFGHKMLVFNLPNVELMFDMKQKYIPNAQSVFKLLKAPVAKSILGYTILGLDKLEARCTRLSDLRIMNRIYKAGKVRKLKFDDIVKLSKQYNLDVSIDEKLRTLDFHGDVEEFVRLYDLRHLEHPITKDKVIGLRVKQVS